MTFLSIAIVRQKTSQLEDHFEQLAVQISATVGKKKIAVHDFKARLLDPSTENKQQQDEFLTDLLLQSDSVSREGILSKIKIYWSFLNISLLERLIHTFGNMALKFHLSNYKMKLKEFRNTTPLCSFEQCFKHVEACPGEGFIEVKFDKKWEECTLGDLEYWKESIAQKFLLPPYVMRIKSFGFGFVKWTIPRFFIASIVGTIEHVDVKAFCEEANILSISINSKECVIHTTAMDATVKDCCKENGQYILIPKLRLKLCFWVLIFKVLGRPYAYACVYYIS